MALIVMLAIGAVELVSLLIGFSPSGAVESVLPDVDAPDLEVGDINAIEVATPDAVQGLSPLSVTLGWLSVGRVPVLVLLVIFLTAFALSGYIVQWAAISALGFALNPWLAAIPAIAGGAYAMRYLGRWIGRIFPRDHTEAASQKDLIGSYATIIRGEARKGQPAEAKTYDLRGRTHYVLIEPDDAATTYGAGARVFIVGQDRNIYRAVTKVKAQEG